jgi:hypothetical protein
MSYFLPCILCYALKYIVANPRYAGHPLPRQRWRNSAAAATVTGQSTLRHPPRRLLHNGKQLSTALRRNACKHGDYATGKRGGFSIVRPRVYKSLVTSCVGRLLRILDCTTYSHLFLSSSDFLPSFEWVFSGVWSHEDDFLAYKIYLVLSGLEYSAVQVNYATSGILFWFVWLIIIVNTTMGCYWYFYFIGMRLLFPSCPVSFTCSY